MRNRSAFFSSTAPSFLEFPAWDLFREVPVHLEILATPREEQRAALAGAAGDQETRLLVLHAFDR